MKMQGKIVVITGGTRGLGRALRVSFGARGNSVVIAARSIDKTSYDRESGILSVRTDVIKELDVKRLADLVVEKYHRIDIWINNAGIWLPHAPIEKIDIKMVHKMMEVNLFGTIYGSKYALIQMRKQKGGVIVNILSSSALDGGIGSSGYCASKFAASGFTKCLRLESENDNVKVVSVYTRGMRTNLFDEEKPMSYDNFMDPGYVAEKIITNLKESNIKQDLVINSQENK